MRRSLPRATRGCESNYPRFTVQFNFNTDDGGIQDPAIGRVTPSHELAGASSDFRLASRENKNLPDPWNRTPVATIATGRSRQS